MYSDLDTELCDPKYVAMTVLLSWLDDSTQVIPRAVITLCDILWSTTAKDGNAIPWTLAGIDPKLNFCRRCQRVSTHSAPSSPCPFSTGSSVARALDVHIMLWYLLPQLEVNDIVVYTHWLLSHHGHETGIWVEKRTLLRCLRMSLVNADNYGRLIATHLSPPMAC